MRTFKEIKSHYNFTTEDEKRLLALKNHMNENAGTVMDSLHSWLLQTKETARFFAEEDKKNRIFDVHKTWFSELFSGPYDSRYYDRLIKIGQKHVKVFVDAHYMNRAMNIVRNVCVDIINHYIEDAEERTKSLISVEKILDINLDIITSSYIEEELRTYSTAYRIRSALLTFSERFSQLMNLVLVLALIGLTIGMVGLFVNDVRNFIMGNLEQGIISALGSLLVLWVMIELINTEIAFLKGGKIRISIFVGVALVAFIRETLIITLRHEKTEMLYYLIALILISGIVYWLVTRSEEKVK